MSLFHDTSDQRGSIIAIACMMTIMGGLLFPAERAGKHRLDLHEVTLATAVIIGVAQALALIPGVSRSGSTITARLFLDLKREVAARFSFLLATPVIMGAAGKQLYDLVKARCARQSAAKLGRGLFGCCYLRLSLHLLPTALSSA